MKGYESELQRLQCRPAAKFFAQNKHVRPVHSPKCSHARSPLTLTTTPTFNVWIRLRHQFIGAVARPQNGEVW